MRLRIVGFVCCARVAAVVLFGTLILVATGCAGSSSTEFSVAEVGEPIGAEEGSDGEEEGEDPSANSQPEQDDATEPLAEDPTSNQQEQDVISDPSVGGPESDHPQDEDAVTEPAAAANEGPTLTILIRSGLPNPTVVLSADDVVELQRLVTELPIGLAPVEHPERLGFSGFILEPLAFGDEQRVVHVSPSGVTTHALEDGAFSSSENFVVLEDPDGALYEQLRAISTASHPDISGGITPFKEL